MCGIFGGSALPNKTIDPVKIKFLALLNEPRGLHSTGVCAIDEENKITINKIVQKPSLAIISPSFVNDITGKTSIIGHARQATVGVVNINNAHPFTFEANEWPNGAKFPSTEKIIGVHNGFVADKTTEQFEFKYDFNVDSQYIFAMLARWGGDPKVLKLLEGAITIAYCVPDKYKGMTFLYRRTPRELHIGYAPEGVYYSSEALPLEIIGCRDISELENLSLTTLKNGEVIDYSILEAPKLKSIKLNAQRLSFMDDLPDDELNHFPEIKKVKIDYTKNNNRHKSWDNLGQASMFPDTKFLNDYNELTVNLLGEVREDLSTYVPEQVENYTDLDSFSDSDWSCGMVVIKFIDNAHKLPIPGLFVVDSVDESINGISVLNGVVPLKFENKDCGTDRTIVIHDPIDSLLTWTMKINPRGSELREIVVQLPYQKKKKDPEGLKILYQKQILRNTLITGEGKPLLSSLYYLIQMNMFGITKTVEYELLKVFKGKKNRWIHNIREKKFM